MKSYYRVMLGAGSSHAPRCLAEGFIGTDFHIHQDLTTKLHENWRSFNQELIPVYFEIHPDRNRISAGLACGALWTVSKGIQQGDIVLCPDGSGRYHLGELVGDYHYAANDILPHRRPVRWLSQVIDRQDMSLPLKHSAGSIGTVSNLSRSGHTEEIERLIGGAPAAGLTTSGEVVEDPSAFALEKHLEDFLVENWAQTELGREFDIYTDEGEPSGQQYQTDTGPLDILAVSKDKRRLLVVELKKGRASDAVVGQTLRYMGYVKEELAEDNQTVHGAIIAFEDDQRIRRALSMIPNIEFYRYKVSFKLIKSDG